VQPYDEYDDDDDDDDNMKMMIIIFCPFPSNGAPVE
jgi:hypothetical protein